MIVYLPPDYDENLEERYPVLYMHDGQNLFDPRTAFVGQHWRTGETIGGMIQAGEIRSIIVVGIYNTGEARIDEYTPTEDPEHKRGGAADLYGRMILEELKPRIDRTYRTRSGSEETALAGSSLGGLVSLHLGLRHPDQFGRLGILSPSAWWDDRVILETVDAFEGRRPRIWLDVGTAEGDEAVRTVRELGERLIAKGWTPGADLFYREVEGAGHTESAWAERLGDVLRFLFGDRDQNQP